MITAVQKEQFFKEIRQGNTKQVLELLAIEPELLSQTNRLRYTPIELAAGNNHWELIEAVAEQYPADENDSQKYGYTLLKALEAKQWETAMVLIKANASLQWRNLPISTTTHYFSSVLHYAMGIGQTKLVLAILEKAPELLKQKNHLTDTPSNIAAMSKKWECIKIIAEKYPADENDSQQYDFALREAIKAKQWETAKLLVKAKASMRYVSNIELHSIVQAGQTDLARAILKKTPNLLAKKNKEDKTPFSALLETHQWDLLPFVQKITNKDTIKQLSAELDAFLTPYWQDTQNKQRKLIELLFDIPVKTDSERLVDLTDTEDSCVKPSPLFSYTITHMPEWRERILNNPNYYFRELLISKLTIPNEDNLTLQQLILLHCSDSLILTLLDDSTFKAAFIKGFEALPNEWILKTASNWRIPFIHLLLNLYDKIDDFITAVTSFELADLDQACFGKTKAERKIASDNLHFILQQKQWDTSIAEKLKQQAKNKGELHILACSGFSQLFSPDECKQWMHDYQTKQMLKAQENQPVTPENILFELEKLKCKSLQRKNAINCYLNIFFELKNAFLREEAAFLALNPGLPHSFPELTKLLAPYTFLSFHFRTISEMIDGASIPQNWKIYFKHGRKTNDLLERYSQIRDDTIKFTRKDPSILPLILACTICRFLKEEKNAEISDDMAKALVALYNEHAENEELQPLFELLSVSSTPLLQNILGSKIKAKKPQTDAEKIESDPYLQLGASAKPEAATDVLQPTPATQSVTTQMMQFGIHQPATTPNKVIEELKTISPSQLPNATNTQIQQLGEINASNAEPAAEPCCLRPA